MHRRLFALAAIALTTAAGTPPPPAVLAPYIRDGHFEPDDYAWMRGYFADATPAQKAASTSLQSWLTQCQAADAARVRAELAQRGVATDAPDWNLGNHGLCGEVTVAARIGDQGSSWTAFKSAVDRARPATQAVIWAAGLAQAAADEEVRDESGALIARPMTDQVLRLATVWDDGEVKGAPPLDPAARTIARALLWLAITRRDAANTAWLKALVARSGWPTIAKVGAAASEQAWMLVQHADDDPVFQHDMLRLMAPLAARGDVSTRNYAMLYDRIMVTLTGRQRYGSQAICADGRQVVRPLEDAAAVDRLRREAGLPDLDGYLAGLNKNFPCPPDVIPPSPAKR